MLTLNLKRDPYWIDLPSSVRLFVWPLSTAIMSAAQSSILKDIGALKEKKDAVLDAKNDDEHRGLYHSLLIKAIARHAIIKWENVLSQDSDEIAPVVDKNVNDLMDIWFMAQDFWRQYTDALSMLESEGKSSGLEQSGTSVAGPTTAKVAKNKGSPAAKAKKIR
jgi:hypothetical protein